MVPIITIFMEPIAICQGYLAYMLKPWSLFIEKRVADFLDKKKDIK
jgi:hypothetical protein